MKQLLLLITCILSLSCTRTQAETQAQKQTAADSIAAVNFNKKKAEAFKYCKANKMNTNVCVLIDMSIHAGKNRMFVVDFKQDSLLEKGLCSHGSCDGSTAPEKVGSAPHFSNVPSSYCSSMGKYKVGNRSYSNYGINVHYKLHGMESTNNNAFRRTVVLHSYFGVPNYEVYPDQAMTSLGCPMVSNDHMTYLDKLFKKRKNVLLWIYK